MQERAAAFADIGLGKKFAHELAKMGIQNQADLALANKNNEAMMNRLDHQLTQTAKFTRNEAILAQSHALARMVKKGDIDARLGALVADYAMERLQAAAKNTAEENEAARDF